MTEAWREANRANWDERVAVHLRSYDLAPLRAGRGRLTPIETAELGDVAGKRILHLQCHIGSDTLALAQMGAEVTGLDFSAPAIQAARDLAAEIGVAARFVVSDLYAAPEVLGEPASFDLVYTTWGTICWLPDIAGWARVIAHFLKPGGALYFADGHPAALVFDDDAVDDAVRGPPGFPGWFTPYFDTAPLIQDDTRDYSDDAARLSAMRTYQYIHPLGAIVSALIDAGLRLEFLHEHPAVAWRMFTALERGTDRLYRWKDKPWLPLAFSLMARRPG